MFPRDEEGTNRKQDTRLERDKITLGSETCAQWRVETRVRREREMCDGETGIEMGRSREEPDRIRIVKLI